MEVTTWTRLRKRAARVRWLPVITFALATFAFMPDALLGLGTFGPFDILEYASPWRDALATTPHVQEVIQNDFLQSYPVLMSIVRALRHGHWLTWTPYIAGGEPIGALPISGVQSVFNLPLLVLPDGYGLAFVAAIRLLFSQTFLYLFLRRFRIGVPVAVFGGVAYTFCGTNLVLFGRITAYMTLPALMWATARLLERRRSRDVAWLAIMGAITWLEGFPAGYANAAAITVALAIAVALPLARGTDALVRPAARSLRAVLSGLALVVVGFALSVGLSAVSVLPFERLAADSGLVSQRHYTSADHLDAVTMPAALSVGALGSVHQPLVMLTKAPNGAEGGAGNAVELEGGAGLVVVLTALAGMVLALLGRLRLSRGQQALYVFGLAATVGGLLLVYYDTPLLALFDRLPLLGQNPVNRFRIVINLGFVLLACLGLQGLLSAVAGEEGQAPGRRPRSRADLALRVCVAVALLGFARMLDSAWPGYWGWLSSPLATSARHKVALELAGAVVFVTIAYLTLWRSGREPRRRAALMVGAVGMAATMATYVTVALPLHSFSPTVNTRLRDPTTPGHRVLNRLVGNQYRILGSGLGTFYSNTSLYYGYLDLRGLSMSTPDLRTLVKSALPEAYSRDKFKVIYVLEENDPVRWSSPVLDDLAVRYFVEGTNETPLAHNVGVRTPVATRAIRPGQLLTAAIRSDGPLAGVAIQIQRAAGCEGSRLMVRAATAAGPIGESVRPAIDAPLPAPGSLAFMLPQGAAPRGTQVHVAIGVGGPPCLVAAGVDRSGRMLVSQMLATQTALKVVSSDQAIYYQRPHAHPIVWLSPRWTPAPTAAAALSLATTPSRTSSYPVPVAGAGAAPASPASGRVLSVHYNDSGFDVRVQSSGRALLATGFTDPANGFSVRVDGRPATLTMVDGALLGAVIGPGIHTVSFGFLVPDLALGLLVSGFSLVIVILLFTLRQWPALPGRRAGGAPG
jgi:hypothetical protein